MQDVPAAQSCSIGARWRNCRRDTWVVSSQRVEDLTSACCGRVFFSGIDVPMLVLRQVGLSPGGRRLSCPEMTLDR